MGAFALLTGYLGWQLRPDTIMYEHGNLRHAPLTGLIGIIAGTNGIIIASAIAAAASVALIPSGAGRTIFVLFAGYWFLHPGADALGTMFVLLMDRTGERLFWIFAAFFHPVAGLTTITRLFPRWEPWLVVSFLVSLLTIYYVGTVDTYDTTVRYLIPAVALLSVRISQSLSKGVVARGFPAEPRPTQR
jgi:hypothetical protein